MPHQTRSVAPGRSALQPGTVSVLSLRFCFLGPYCSMQQMVPWLPVTLIVAHCEACPQHIYWHDMLLIMSGCAWAATRGPSVPQTSTSA